jgi:hypothetical protein
VIDTSLPINVQQAHRFREQVALPISAGEAPEDIFR